MAQKDGRELIGGLCQAFQVNELSGYPAIRGRTRFPLIIIGFTRMEKMWAVGGEAGKIGRQERGGGSREPGVLDAKPPIFLDEVLLFMLR
ncbi:MAG: hypothetical protein K4305_05965 [Chlorobium sp.]|uniref:hypothetical protein n=1 Tax=Chlorobium sp. TaxID=1095 RepID=UPI002F40827B